jgi:hypothetical protein
MFKFKEGSYLRLFFSFGVARRSMFKVQVSFANLFRIAAYKEAKKKPFWKFGDGREKSRQRGIPGNASEQMTDPARGKEGELALGACLLISRSIYRGEQIHPNPAAFFILGSG